MTLFESERQTMDVIYKFIFDFVEQNSCVPFATDIQRHTGMSQWVVGRHVDFLRRCKFLKYTGRYSKDAQLVVKSCVMCGRIITPMNAYIELRDGIGEPQVRNRCQEHWRRYRADLKADWDWRNPDIVSRSNKRNYNNRKQQSQPTVEWEF